MSIDDLRTNVDTLLSNVDLSNIDIEDIKISDIDTMKTKLDSDVANAKSSSSITPEEVKELEDKLNDIKTIIDKLKDFKKKADLVVLDNKMIDNIKKMIAKNPSLASSYQKALDSLETKKSQHEADLLNPTLEYNDALVEYQNKYGVKMNRVVPTPPPPIPVPPTPSTPTPATPSTPTGPIPGVPTPPSGPTEPLPTPTTPLTSSASIQYYVDNGLLPKMSESDLIATCKRLGIKGKDGKFPSDLDFELDSKQMSRLVNAREVRDARLKAGVVEKQQEVADRYKDLVQDNIETFKNAKDKDTKRIIYGSTRELNDSRHEQENKIAGINEHDVKTYHAFGEGYLNDRSRDASERVNKKQEKNDKKLDETYREADRISDELNRGRANKTLGAITEIRLSIRLGRLENRIERLQKKQGKLNDRQTKIVNKSTDRYVKKVTKQQRRYKREQTRLDNYVNHTNAIDQRTADLSAERTRVNNNMTMSGLNALDRTAMRLNGAALTARLAALRGRKFVLDTNEQIVRAVTSGRTM